MYRFYGRARSAFAVFSLMLLVAFARAQAPVLKEVKVYTDPVAVNLTYEFNVILKGINAGDAMKITMGLYSGTTLVDSWDVTIPSGQASLPSPGKRSAPPTPGDYILRATADPGDTKATMISVASTINGVAVTAEYLPISRAVAVAKPAVRTTNPARSRGPSATTTSKPELLYEVGLDGINQKSDYTVTFNVFKIGKSGTALRSKLTWDCKLPAKADKLAGSKQHSLPKGVYLLVAYRKNHPEQALGVAFEVK